MDPKLEQILKHLPPAKAKGRLESYREFILRLRRDGRSYTEIQQILTTKCGIHISVTGIFKFVHSRQRPRIATNSESPLQENSIHSIHQEPIEREGQPKVTRRWSQEEIEAMRAKARVSAHKPTAQPKPKPLFHYDPNRPLTNKPIDNKETNK
jgi:hypothetical protein